MVMVALFRMVKTWNLPKWPSPAERIFHTVEALQWARMNELPEGNNLRTLLLKLDMVNDSMYMKFKNRQNHL